MASAVRRPCGRGKGDIHAPPTEFPEDALRFSTWRRTAVDLPDRQGGGGSPPPFNVARLVVGTDVQAREPIGVADVFPAGTQTVCCFLEARDITQVTEVEMVWFFGDEEVARVPLTLGAGARWRTYSRKQIGAHQGNWKVDLQDMAGQILGTVQFMVE